MNIFILVNEDNDEPIENGSSEGIPGGDPGADQEPAGENTGEETEQEQENTKENEVSENARTNDTQQIELVDYSESLEEMNDRLEEIASYSFASVLILANILLIKIIQWIFSGFR